MRLPLPHSRALLSLAPILAFIWLGCVVYVALEQVAGFLTVRDFDGNALRRIFIITLYYWLPWVLLAPFVAVCSGLFPIRPTSWALPLTMHVLSLLLLALIHGLAIGVVYHYSPAMTAQMAAYSPWQHSGHFLFGDDMFLFDAVFYAVIAATLNIRNFQLIVRQQELDSSRLNEHLAELRFQTLRTQVDPHFLFNALNAVSVLVRKGETGQAGEMIARLSRFFRQTLESAREHWVALEEELEMVRQYVAIEQVRFGDRLRVTEQCEQAVQRVAVPAMLLQPLVENALTHGLGRKVGACELSLDCRRHGEGLRIELRDSGVGGLFHADPAFEEGIGLTNVRARLALMYGDQHAFRIEGTPGQGTRVTIDLPLKPTVSLKAAV